MATIVFEEVQPAKCQEKYSDLKSCINYKKFFDGTNDKILITSSVTSDNLMSPALGNGLLGTIYRAYCQHVPLTLRPDDIWIAIITSFGNYVKNHSEEMRSCFVDHAGKKQLVVSVGSPLLQFTTDEHWTCFLALMADKIKSNTKSEIFDWIVPTFSTTTETDITISHIALMGTVSEYFDLKYELGCGLSKVTLAGSIDDWFALQTKCKKLYDFGIKDLSDWADLLIPVIDEFINAYQQNIDKDFWQRICTSKRRGSGSQQTFRGWFLVFAPFDDKGKYLLRPAVAVAKDNIYAIVNDDDIVDCAIDVQVTIDDHGEMHQAVFYAGLLRTEYNEVTNELSPHPAWIMIQKKHIVYDDLVVLLEKSISDRSKNDSDYLHDLLKFSYHVATRCYFPNDKLNALVTTCVSYYWNYGRKEITEKTGCDYGKFLSWLAEKIHYGYEPNMFAKYIDPTKIDDIVTSYNN